MSLKFEIELRLSHDALVLLLQVVRYVKIKGANWRIFTPYPLGEMEIRTDFLVFYTLV